MNPIIAKIEKLLHRAKAQEGEPEGEIAARLAAKMMAAHAIEMSEVNAEGGGEPDPIVTENVKMRQSVWRRQLAHALARHCSCTTSYVSSRGGMHVTFYGRKSDIEVASYLFTVCERQIEKAAKGYVASLDWADRGEKRTRGNSFRRSAIRGLGTKLREIRDDTRAENAEGFSLVRTRLTEVDAWVEENTNLRTVRDAGHRYNQDGYEAGRDINLAAGVEGQARPELPGRKLLEGK